MKRRAWISGLVMGAALLLAACGSDESGDATTAAAGSADEAGAEAFLADVDETCVTHAVAVNELSDELGIPQGFRDSAAYDQGRADAAREQADGAAAIEPPGDLTAGYERFTDSLEAYADAYQENADLAAAGDKAAWEASREARTEIGNEQLEAAGALGLQACARKLSPEQEAAVQEITERVLTGADPEGSCADDLSDNFREVLGGERGCLRELRGIANEGVAPEFLYFTGVDGVLASANVNYASTAGAAQQYLIYDFIWDSDAERWLMDSSFVAGPAEPAPSGGAGGSS